MELLEKERSSPTATIALGSPSINGLMYRAISDAGEMLPGLGEQGKQLKGGGAFEELLFLTCLILPEKVLKSKLPFLRALTGHNVTIS